MPAIDLFQGHLSSIIKQIFPKEQITINTRKESTLLNISTGRFLELDIVLPDIDLCFEFQDNYHYTSTWYSQVPVHSIQLNDAAKLSMVNRLAITMIVVPYWWDGSKESLMATINFYRPDLMLETTCSPVPLNHHAAIALYNVPGVGDVMLASFPASPATFQDSVSPQNPWWMGEKYDGIRGIWNPHAKALYSRLGNIIDAPEHNYYLCKQVFSYLDTEIWFGRGFYLSAFRLLKSVESDISYLRLVVFDVPSGATPPRYEERYGSLLFCISDTDPCAIVAMRALCQGTEYQLWLHEILAEGGEGIILQKNGSTYEGGRTNSLIKMKETRSDSESLVVDLNSEFCTLKMPSGVTFTMELPQVALQIGDVVTLEYESYSKDLVPISPAISRVRSDLNWEGVVQEYTGGRPTQILSTMHAKSSLSGSDVSEEDAASHQEFGFEQFKNRRNFFEEFAAEHNFDPLVGKNWYSVKRATLKKKKGFITLLKTWYHGKLGHALEHLFPEIGFSQEQYNRLHWTPTKFFAETKNRRAFFNRIAKTFGFDSLIPKNWYSISRYTVTSRKDALSVLEYHNGSYRQALIDLFPEIGLSLQGFTKNETKANAREGNARMRSMRRELVEYAKSKFLNPAFASTWYSIPLEYLRADKKIGNIVKFFKSDPAKMLVRLFPKLHLDPTKFISSSKQYSAREFLLNFANSAGFDPLAKENWYAVKREQVLNFKGGITFLKPYGGRLGHAVSDIFPDIGFNISHYYKLHWHPAKYWGMETNRRSFFEEVATTRGFDVLVPENWYNLSKSDIKDAKQMLAFHNKWYAGALVDLFPEVHFDLARFASEPKKRLEAI